jgi:hypothetical protein
MIQHASLTDGEGVGHVGMVWLLLLVGASPVIGALLDGGEWGALPTVGLLLVLLALGKLVQHYAGWARRDQP